MRLNIVSCAIHDNPDTLLLVLSQGVIGREWMRVRISNSANQTDWAENTTVRVFLLHPFVPVSPGQLPITN